MTDEDLNALAHLWKDQPIIGPETFTIVHLAQGVIARDARLAKEEADHEAAVESAMQLTAKLAEVQAERDAAIASAQHAAALLAERAEVVP